MDGGFPLAGKCLSIETAKIDERPPQTETPYWNQSAPSRWPARQDTRLRRFLGGSPLAVLIKLVLVSLIVGALLMWLNIRPADVFRMLSNLVDRLWSLSFDAIREFGTYIVAGAAIVLPVWLILRILSYRAPR
jgi:hypothetical protein